MRRHFLTGVVAGVDAILTVVATDPMAAMPSAKQRFCSCPSQVKTTTTPPRSMTGSASDCVWRWLRSDRPASIAHEKHRAW